MITLEDTIHAYTIRRAYAYQQAQADARRTERNARWWLDAARHDHLTAQLQRITKCPTCDSWRWDDQCRGRHHARQEATA